MPFGTVEQAIADIAAGKFVVVADDEARENEGDLICAAQSCTPEHINFMTQHARGLICLTLTPERCDDLGLPQMVDHNTEAHETAFTISIDADRALRRDHRHQRRRPRAHHPGRDGPPHGAPPTCAAPVTSSLRARARGACSSASGQTEASVDLARLAGLAPAGVICEIMNADGSMARRPDLEAFCAAHGIVFITVAQIVAHRLQHERLLHRVATARLPRPSASSRSSATGTTWTAPSTSP